MVQQSSFTDADVVASTMNPNPNSNPNQKPKKLPLPIKLVVGAIAGVVGTSCVFPIDMVKTRLQAQSKGSGVQYAGPIDCFCKIIATEGGISALYRGLAPNLVGVTPEKAIKLAVNELLRDNLENLDGSISLANEILAGGGAGFCQVIATNPMEIVKIRMQLQAFLPEIERKSAVEIVKGLGIKGLYQGTSATLMRDVPFSILFFPAYANLKASFADSDGRNSMLSLIGAGGIAGALAAGAVTPTDVIKTRLQLAGGKEKYKNIPFAFKEIVKEDGIGALYKGAIPRMAVVSPLFAIALLSFEKIKDIMISKGML